MWYCVKLLYSHSPCFYSCPLNIMLVTLAFFLWCVWFFTEDLMDLFGFCVTWLNNNTLVLPNSCTDIFNFLVYALCNIYLNRRVHVWRVKIHSQAFVKLAGKVFCEISADLSDNFKDNFNMSLSVLYWLWRLSSFSILLNYKKKRKVSFNLSVLMLTSWIFFTLCWLFTQ